MTQVGLVSGHTSCLYLSLALWPSAVVLLLCITWLSLQWCQNSSARLTNSGPRALTQIFARAKGRRSLNTELTGIASSVLITGSAPSIWCAAVVPRLACLEATTSQVGHCSFWWYRLWVISMGDGKLQRWVWQSKLWWLHVCWWVNLIKWLASASLPWEWTAQAESTSLSSIWQSFLHLTARALLAPYQEFLNAPFSCSTCFSSSMFP